MLSSPIIQDDAVLSFWLYILLSGAWSVMVVLCGTYYLLTFGAMMRMARHLKMIECLLLDSDPTIDARSLFEHSPHVSRSTSVVGYVVVATIVLVAAIGPQFFFHEWWGVRVGLPMWGLWFTRSFVGAQVLWLLGYGVAVVGVNRPAKCTHHLNRPD